MSKNRHKPEQIIAKLREIEVKLCRGTPVAAAVKKIAVTEQRYYRWRKEYGGSGIQALNSGHVDIINNSAYFNNASPELKRGPIFAGGKTKDIRVISNIMVAPKRILGQVGEGGSVQESDASHNIRVDSKFKKPSLDDKVLYFNIAPDSPAATAGRPEAFGPVLDFDGKPRPLGSLPSAHAYQGE